MIDVPVQPWHSHLYRYGDLCSRHDHLDAMALLNRSGGVSYFHANHRDVLLNHVLSRDCELDGRSLVISLSSVSGRVIDHGGEGSHRGRDGHHSVGRGLLGKARGRAGLQLVSFVVSGCGWDSLHRPVNGDDSCGHLFCRRVCSDYDHLCGYLVDCPCDRHGGCGCCAAAASARVSSFCVSWGGPSVSSTVTELRKEIKLSKLRAAVGCLRRSSVWRSFSLAEVPRTCAHSADPEASHGSSHDWFMRGR